MTIHRRLNVQGLGGNHTTWWLVKTLLDAGWTVPLSGSGTGGLYATSNVFDTTQWPKHYSALSANGVGAGSEPWGHPGCWVVMEDPGGNRQFLLQRSTTASNTTDDDWHLGYSPAGRFGESQTPGVDWDENTIPTAPDVYDLFAVAGSFSSYFVDGAGYSMVHVAADDTPSPSGEYGFCLIEMKPASSSSGVENAMLFFDDLRDVPAGHPHPLVIGCRNEDSVFTVGNIGGTSTPRYCYTIQDYGGGGEALLNQLALHGRYGGTVYYPTHGGVGPDEKERIMPYIWGFTGTEGYIGLSRWFRWAAHSRAYPATANNRQLLYLDETVIADLWDGSTLPRTI